MIKIGRGEEPEAFLITFKWVATTIQWLEEYWDTLLALYLMGPAQTVYRNLDIQEALKCRKVKATILNQMCISQEIYHQQFQWK